MRISRWLTLASLIAAGSRAIAQPGDQPVPKPAPTAGDQPAPAGPPPPPAPAPNWAPPTPVEEPKPAPPPKPPAPEPMPKPGEGAVQPAIPAASPPEQIAVASEPSTELEIYGAAMLDLGYDFGRIGDPLWEDVLRPTKLPAFPDEFGKGGRFFEGVRQSRFGVTAKTPTSAGEIYTKFEFELFGVGVDAGQTTFRLRHFYGQWKGLRAGQTWSLFMDPDVFPNSIEYWGPNGMVFFRNVQLAYQLWHEGDSDFTIAVERPGGSSDTNGLVSDRFDLTSVVPRFPAPDVTAHFRYGDGWGHVQLAAIFRYMAWDDLAMTPVIEGHAFGWGVNASANVKLAPTIIKLQAVYGHGIENYMNDAGADIGPRPSGSLLQPVEGSSLPVLGLVGFVDIDWNAYFTSTVGYSFVWIDNSELQAPAAFHMGHYALGDVLYHPTDSLFFGPELQFGRRTNNSDGFSVNDYRLQFSIKYSFSKKLGGAR